MNAITPAPRIFTPPVAVVFRQLIAAAISFRRRHTGHARGEYATASRRRARAVPGNSAEHVSTVLERALPPLPAGLEYRLIDNDLVLRDADADVIVAVLRDALGTTVTLKD